MFDIIIGVLAIVLGILSALQRIFKPESSRKLVAMRKTYGEKAGSIVHLVSYAADRGVLVGYIKKKADLVHKDD